MNPQQTSRRDTPGARWGHRLTRKDLAAVAHVFGITVEQLMETADRTGHDSSLS